MRQSPSVVASSTFETLVDLLEARAADDPERLIYTFLADGEDQTVSITHGELRERARAIAAALQQDAVPGDRALLLHPPGIDYIAAFLGCLYAGVIAVPAYPVDPKRLNRTLPRLQAIVRDAQAAFALTTTAVLAISEMVFGQAPDLQALRWIATDSLDPRIAEAWQSPIVSRKDLAFLQYTSGSTNSPKGVELTHANLLYNLELIRQVCPVTPESVFVSWLPPYHDMGLIAFILGPLYGNVPGVLMSPLSFVERPIRWLQAVSRYRGTISCAPNFGFELSVRRTQPQQRVLLDLGSLGFLGSGGEPIRVDTVQRFIDTFAPCGLPRDAFHPLYGLAEASLFVTGARARGQHTTKAVYRWALERNRAVEAASDGRGTTTLVGCGKPLGEDKIAIVDPDSLSRCPPRQIGEVWVASPSVAQGYWNRPEVTQKVFHARVADSGEGPFLRTGDLGFIDDGELYITGRIKDLIIINGTNHYAEDIEVTVQGSNAVLRQGCGAAFSIELEGQERLVVVQEVSGSQTSNFPAVIADISQAISEHHQLAAYAVVLIKPGTIPKTSSGKIQRHVCRSEYLEGSLDVVTEWVAASAAQTDNHDSIEAMLVAEVARELRRAPGEIDTNVVITRYGLDSLAAYNLTHRIETATGVLVEAASVLDGITIRELAKQIAASSGGAAAAMPASGPTTVTGEHPLSHGQEALWFLDKLAPESSAYHLAQAARIEGEFSITALRTAFQQLVERHAMLRTTFNSHSGQPVQHIHAQMDVPLIELDVTGWTRDQIDDRLHQEAYRPFDLERGPLIRIAVCTGFGSEGNFLLISAHHIVTDLWSLTIMIRELGVLYTAAVTGTSATLPPLGHQYIDFVTWQRTRLAGPDGERLWAEWRDLLGDPPVELDLPTERSRPALQTFRGSTYTHNIDPGLSAQLNALSQTNGTTLFMTLLAAFEVILQKHSGQTTFLLGTPTVGRTRSEWADVVGFFVNPIVLAADLTKNPTFETLLSNVRRAVITALAKADYPIALLVEKLHPVRDASRSPLFQVMFALQSTANLGLPAVAAFSLGQPGVKLSLGKLCLQSYPLSPRAAQFDLALMAAELDGALLVSWQFNTDLFDEATVRRMARHFEVLLEEVVGDPRQPITTVPILSAHERKQLLYDWNQTEHQFESPRCIHQLVEEQAKRTPDAVAITFGGESLTFADLTRRANQLANHLHELGVGPEVPVAICVERSLEMMIGLLGILGAGGAYLPLDPEYPVEHIQFTLNDAEPLAILTQARFAERFAEYEGTILCLDTDWPVIADNPEEAVFSGVIATNLAYILYTSGSTGRPKGVLIPHAGACNYLLWLQETFALRATDNVLQIAPLTFDASITECFWALAAGARVTLAAPGGQRDPAYLAKTIGAEAITVVAMTPSALRILLEQPPSTDLDSLRLILCGGEALAYEVKERICARTKAQLYNLYGPTETSVVATYRRCEPSPDHASVPIGRPIANVRVRILSPDLELVPIGVSGEIHIGGAGIGRGYLGRPALTEDKFIEDPFSREPRERLYKTGDLARYRPDGDIEFLGRLDHQVKVRGHRIELGEVESVLGEHMQVHECVVMARDDLGGEQRLVAYVVPRWEEPPKVDDLRDFLKTKLPAFMVPSAFVILKDLPLTSSGKLDRNLLPAPGSQRPDQGTEFVAPRSADEFRLCELWGQILNLEVVGIYDDFFDLGGDSLRAAQLAAKISAATEREVSVRFVMQHRNVAAAAIGLRTLPSLRALGGKVSRKPLTSQDGHLQIERRSLLSLFASGNVASVQAAALAYLPTALIDHTGLSRQQIVDEWCDNLPLFNGVYETPIGRIATVVLPRFGDELYTDPEGLIRELVEALRLVARLGARCVSLTGLLPSATDYGRDLVSAVSGLEMPRITTGHATTAASVVLAIRKILQASGRDFAHERVAFLGLGSIGMATLSASLQLLSHPAEITLCDMAAKRDHLLSIRDQVQRELGYRGHVGILESQASVPGAIYEASLIVGATNAADVLDVRRLRPGTILVDDSAPHCFNETEAIERFSIEKDILFTEGGILRGPQPLPQLRYLPRSVQDMSLLKKVDVVDPCEITGCVLSSALSTAPQDLEPTIGLVDATSCVQHYRALETLGFEAGTLRCGSMVISERAIQLFRERFGKRTD